MSNELVAIQLSFLGVSMIFAYLAINFMDSKHSILFPFFLIGSIVFLIVMVDHDTKILMQMSPSVNTSSTNIFAVYSGLNWVLYVVIFYVFLFILYESVRYIMSYKKQIGGKNKLKKL